jgi:hypothetical protein
VARIALDLFFCEIHSKSLAPPTPSKQKSPSIRIFEGLLEFVSAAYVRWESGIAFSFLYARPGRISHSKQGATTHGRTAGTTAGCFPNGCMHDSGLYYGRQKCVKLFSTAKQKGAAVVCNLKNV